MSPTWATYLFSFRLAGFPLAKCVRPAKYCSISDSQGEDQASSFLSRNSLLPSNNFALPLTLLVFILFTTVTLLPVFPAPIHLMVP